MAASVGSLVAELSANTASFQKDMGKAAAILNSHAAGMSKTVAGIEKRISGIGKVFTATLSVGAVAAFAKSVIDTGDQLSKTSTKLGISVEDLSAYQYAARLAGTSNDDLTQGIAKLGKAVAEAITKPSSDAAQALGNLGVTTDDMRNKNLGKIFEDIAPKIAGISNETTRLQYQTALFGKTGFQLQPLLASLSEASEEARRLGLTTGTEFAKSAEIFNDTLSRMGSQLAAFGRTALLPVINLFNELHKDRGESNLEQAVSTTQAKIDAFKKSVEEGGSALSKFLNVKPNLKYLSDLEAQLAAATERLNKFREQQGLNQSPPQDSPGQKSTNLLSDVGQVSSFQRLQGDLRKATAEATAAINLDEKEKSEERLAIAFEEYALKIKLANLTAGQQKEINEEFLAYQRAAAARSAFELRTPLEKLFADWENTTRRMQDATAKWAQDFSERLTDLVIDGKASFKDFARSVIRDLVRIQLQKQIAGLAGSLGGSLFGTGGSGSYDTPPTDGLLSGFAHGGNPPVGKPYIVGENGPELRVDRSPSTIIPNGSFGGANVTNVFNISTGVAETVRAEMMALAPVIEERSKQGVLVAIERGGRYSQAVGRKA